MALHTIWEKNGVRWVCTDAVTADELLKATMDLYGDALFDSLRFHIIDLLEADEFLASEKDMRKLLHLGRAAALTNRTIRVAILVNESAPPGYREATANTEGKQAWPTRHFPSIDAARAWFAER